MFNKEKISKLKKGVLIVNNARGAIMDAQAVADASASGYIGGQLYLFNSSSYCLLPSVNNGHTSPIIKHFSQIQKEHDDTLIIKQCNCIFVLWQSFCHSFLEAIKRQWIVFLCLKFLNYHCSCLLEQVSLPIAVMETGTLLTLGTLCNCRLQWRCLVCSTCSKRSSMALHAKPCYDSPYLIWDYNRWPRVWFHPISPLFL